MSVPVQQCLRHLIGTVSCRIEVPAATDTLIALARAATECTGETNASFAELTIERLARQAGISRASFYLYFEDKAELVRAWNRDLDAQVAATITDWWNTDEPSRDTVRHVLHQLAVIHRENRIVVAAIQEMSAHDYLLREALIDSFQRKRGKLRAHILRGQKEGWIVRCPSARYYCCLDRIDGGKSAAASDSDNRRREIAARHRCRYHLAIPL